MLNGKQQSEQAAFAEFLRRLDTTAEWSKIESRPDPEPDLLCYSHSGERVAFELVSLTDSRIAKVQAAGSRARQDAFYTEDPTERIVRSKLSKSYRTDAARIELLIYTDGQIVTPDDAIVPTILPLLEEFSHPFDVVWFMGEGLILRLWPNA